VINGFSGKLLNLLPPDAKFDFRWGSDPDPAPPHLSAVFKGPTSEEKEGKERRRERGGQEEKGGDRKREGKGFAGPM